FSRLLDPSDASVVGRADKEVPELRIRGESAPVGTANCSRKDDARCGWCGGRTIDPRCERSLVIESATLFDKFATGFGVFFGCFLRGNQVGHGEAHSSNRLGL